MAASFYYGQRTLRCLRLRLSHLNMFRCSSTIDANPQIQKSQTNIRPIIEHETFKEVFLQNESLREYNRGSREAYRLDAVLESMNNTCEDIPLVIDGKKQQSRARCYQMMPHKKTQKLVRFCYATDQQLFKAIDNANNAQKSWDREAFSKRIEIWERAANLLANKYRAEVVAATMLGQGKVLVDAEQDAADLIDMIRISAQYFKLLTQWQPTTPHNSGCFNHLLLHGMEGFVGTFCAFNSTALAATMALTPVLMGNSVLWRPSENAILSSWIIYKSMIEAGLPENIIAFVPSDEALYGQTITHSEYLSGINYFGSGVTFKKLWKLVAKYLEYYHNFPRLVGECGGKNFHFVHESADPNVVVEQTLRAAFEYSGQKRTSCSRLYVPHSLWESHIKNELIEKTAALKVGEVNDPESFTSAVISADSFSRLLNLLEAAQRHPKFRVLTGGKYSGNKGFFVNLTILQCTDLQDRIFKDDYCGPVLVVYVYKDNELKRVMDNVASFGSYALVGSIFAKDDNFIKTALQHFKNCAGSLYINDKTTSVVMGHQPFSGTRMSGTNDKIGSPYYLLRWISMQTIKETYDENNRRK